MTRPFSRVSFHEQVCLDQMLRSKPGLVVDWCKKTGAGSLRSLPAAEQLKEADPRCYALLVAEARAQGFPVR